MPSTEHRQQYHDKEATGDTGQLEGTTSTA